MCLLTTYVMQLMEALRFSERSVLTRTTRRNIPEDGIFHSHRSENLKSSTANTVHSSPILATLMMEALRSFETSDLTRATWLTSQKTAFFIVTAV
jgi:hypothetical protein